MNYPNYQQMYPNPYLQNVPSVNNNSIIWVQGESGAKAYPVAPGNSLALFDSENDRFFIKTTDASGMPLPLRTFNYIEQTENSTTTTIQEKEPEYVTRKEFEEFVAKMTKNNYSGKGKNNGKPTIQRNSEQ